MTSLSELSTLTQQGGYEVFIVEVGGVSAEQCLQRNIHNRSEDDITQAAGLWQPTPPTYPLLDVEGLLGVSKEKVSVPASPGAPIAWLRTCPQVHIQGFALQGT